MTGGSYAVFDHTADLGIEVTAPTAEQLFETAAAALFEIQFGACGAPGGVERAVRVAGADQEELLVRWLAELLYLHDAEGLVFSRFEVLSLGPHGLEGRAWGDPYDAERHEVRTQIKAVTYHQASVRRESGQWRARVVFDV